MDLNWIEPKQRRNQVEAKIQKSVSKLCKYNKYCASSDGLKLFRRIGDQKRNDLLKGRSIDSNGIVRVPELGDVNWK